MPLPTAPTAFPPVNGEKKHILPANGRIISTHRHPYTGLPSIWGHGLVS